jgi:hypothetical protein
MGMYDNIICEVSLPDGKPHDGVYFQTKDFNCELVTHTITKDGRLLLERIDSVETVPKAERPYPDAPDDDIMSLAGSVRTHTSKHDANFHGIVNFYTLDDDQAWREYYAKFTDGNLVGIEAMADE